MELLKEHPGPSAVAQTETREDLRPPTADKPRKERDLRIDFFRGVSLLFIYTDHLAELTHASIPLYLQFTPRYWALASAADLFVFLSGFVFNLVYSKIFDRKGFWLGYHKAMLRCSQLLVSNFITLFVVLALVGAFATDQEARLFRLTPFFEQPAQTFGQALTLTYLAYSFDILPLYAVLLLAMPPLLFLLRRNALAACAISLALWLAAQVSSRLNLPNGSGDWHFNPLAWQLLFFAGALLNSRIGKDNSALLKKVRHPLPAYIGLGVLALVALHHLLLVMLHAKFLPASFGAFIIEDIPWDGSQAVRPLRLLYFLLAVYVVATYTKSASAFWSSAIARPLVKCGQHSLEIFCVGLVLTYAAVMLLGVKGHPFFLSVIALNLLGWAIMMASAAYLSWKKTQQ